MSPPIIEAAADESSADVTNGELAAVHARLHCAQDRRQFFCRALAAFAAGRRPSGRPDPVGMAGAGIVVATPGSGLEEKEPVPVLSALVLSDSGARSGTLDPDSDHEKDAVAVMRAVLAGEPLPPQNPAVVYARSMREVGPAAPAGRSLAWTMNGIRSFARDTDMGVVVVDVSRLVFVVSVFPRTQSVR
jgi:hypothetical protein